jgi:enterochelin esterase-like enzyme
MLITLKHTGKSIEFGKQLHVLMPEGKPPINGFRVLYLLHGYYGDFTDWLYMSNIIRYQKPSDLMIVFPDASNSYYVNHPSGLRFEDYIINDVVSLIENTFKISSKRDDRYIAGLSMGGFGALYLGFKYHNMFSKIFSLSGVVFATDIVKHLSTSRIYQFETLFDVNNLEQYNLLSYAIKHQDEKIQLTLYCGTEDFLYQDNIQFHQQLKQNNIHHDFIESKGAHDWDYWDEKIQEVLIKL